MPQTVDRAEVRKLLRGGAALVEVLPRKEYDDERLEGAVSIPLAAIAEQAPRQLSQERPIVVYCYDSL